MILGVNDLGVTILGLRFGVTIILAKGALDVRIYLWAYIYFYLYILDTPFRNSVLGYCLAGERVLTSGHSLMHVYLSFKQGHVGFSNKVMHVIVLFFWILCR